MRGQSGNTPPIQVKGQKVCGSMDIKALYPSIMKEMASKAAMKSIIASTNLGWENIDVKLLARNVAMKYDRKEITDNGLEEIVPLP